MAGVGAELISKDNRMNLKLIFLAIALGLATVFFKGFLIIFTIIMITGIALRYFLPVSDKDFLVRLFITGILVRVVIFVIFYIFSVYRGGYGEIVPDSRLYFIKALETVRAWTGENVTVQVEEAVGRNGYVFLLAISYLLLGYNPASAAPISIFSDKLINCLIGTLSGIPIFYIAKEVFGRSTAKLSSLLTVFYPSLVLWSMTNTREPANIMLVCLLLFSFMKLQKEKKMRYFILFLTCLLLLRTLRLYFFNSVLFVIAVSFFIAVYMRFKRKIPVLLLIIILIFSFLNLTDSGRMLKNNFLNFNTLVRKIYINNTGIRSQGGSAYNIYDNTTLVDGQVNKIEFFKGAINGFLSFLFVPFPWSLTSMMQILSYPQVLLWYFLFPFSLIGILLALRYRFKVSFVVLVYSLCVLKYSYRLN